MVLKAREVARILGVSEPRVTQLKQAHGIKEWNHDVVDRLRADRLKQRDYLEQRKQYYRDQERRWQDLLDRLDKLVNRLTVLAASTAALAGVSAARPEGAARSTARKP